MRIRQVRPEFWTDPLVSQLGLEVRLLYIGFWCVADDAGWMRWDIPQLGALLLPYEPVRRRETAIRRSGDALSCAGRLVIHECLCAEIPTLPKHQRTGGTPYYGIRDEHRKHVTPDKSVVVQTSGDVTERNGTERNGTSLRELLRETTDPETGRVVWLGPESKA